MPPYPKSDFLSHFFTKVRKTDSCWLWLAGKDWDGYGIYWVHKRSVRAHRWIYEQLKEAVPAHLVIDHLCKTPACVNPDHMRVVTNGENVLCGESFSAKNKKKTYCKRGHKLSDDNIFTVPSHPESRRCRTCHEAQWREWRRKYGYFKGPDEFALITS